MNSRKVAILILMVILAIALILTWQRQKPGSLLQEGNAGKEASSLSALATPPRGLADFGKSASSTSTTNGQITSSTPPPSSEELANIELNKVRHMLGDYHTLMGENPVGTNAEIMASLMGANSRQATLGPAEGQTLNNKGELVDPLGTPYFFHQLSKDLMEIRSAGPDKVMWTDDDQIAR